MFSEYLHFSRPFSDLFPKTFSLVQLTTAAGKLLPEGREKTSSIFLRITSQHQNKTGLVLLSTEEGSGGESRWHDTLRALQDHVYLSPALVEIPCYRQAVAVRSLSASHLGEVPTAES